ncbi:MAG: phosphoserine phosphatase SerB [Sumerlaeia bacterium]
MKTEQFFLVLTTAQAQPALTLPIVRGTSLAATRHGLKAGATRWLKAGQAVEISLTGNCDPAILMRQMRAHLGQNPVDVFVVPAENRRKRLLLADMDSTIIPHESLDDLAAFAGVEAEVADITTRAMAGELDYNESLRARVALIEGLPLSHVADMLPDIACNPGAATLVHTMRAHGARTVLVTSGFRQFAQHVQTLAGFDVIQSNIFEETPDGRVAGVRDPILNRDSKGEALARHAAELGIDPDDAMAVGDGANDLSMLTAAGYGVAYRAKSLLRHRLDLQINHSDLTALLYLQGYSADQFVSAGEPEAPKAIRILR